MKITCSFGSRFSLACVRKLLNLCPVIPPRNAGWKTSPLVGEIAIDISPSLTTYLSICPLSQSCSSVTSCCPYIISTLVYKYTMIRYSMAHEPGGIIPPFFQDFRAVPISWECPGQLTRYNVTSSVLATVRSWNAGYRGRRCLNSWYICASVSRQFSFIMSFRQFLISSSTPPRDLSAIFPLASTVQRYFLP